MVRHTLVIILFAITFIFEFLGLALTYWYRKSFCVQGREIEWIVMPFMLLVPSCVIMNLSLLIIVILFEDMGLDPVSIVHNLIMGTIEGITGIIMLIAIVFNCGNSAIIVYVISGIFVIIAAILHLILSSRGIKDFLSYI
ncbi:uncharacterized protein LOC119673958 [Teleopsis dalmanni]|uniref:uncharacterized protein LOC119673958 n=1 Tax=Teleopsis dalmanni TaxID=139649 RepID=UPI0018CE5EBB|nr:uncharacterized protein LOC119673958 [Teleopsis dalmanni]